MQWRSAYWTTSDKYHELAPMQLTIMSKGKETNLSQVDCSSFITSLINFIDLKNYKKADSAFHYWAEQNSKVLSNWHGLFLLLQ